MTVLILHGVMGYAGAHWEQWLHDQLVKQKHTVIMPNLPNSEHPSRKEWLRKVRDILTNIDLNDLVIVAHSLGVPTALDFLEQTEGKIKALVSVSGFYENYDSPFNDFFMKEKTVDLEKVSQHVKKVYALYGDNDPYVPQEKLQDFAAKTKAKTIVVPQGGHLNTEAGYTTFPKLLEVVTSLS